MSPWERDPETGLPTSFPELRQTKKYKQFSQLYSCWPSCWGDDGGGDLPEGDYNNYKPFAVCTTQTANGWGIIKGTDYSDALITSQYGREKTGCYKAGVTEGDNQYSSIAAPDYMKDEVFKDLVKNR
jgi:hypothetical protein